MTTRLRLAAVPTDLKRGVATLSLIKERRFRSSCFSV
jgi:hypothetical protein